MIKKLTIFVVLISGFSANLYCMESLDPLKALQKQIKKYCIKVANKGLFSISDFYEIKWLFGEKCSNDQLKLILNHAAKSECGDEHENIINILFHCTINNGYSDTVFLFINNYKILSLLNNKDEYDRTINSALCGAAYSGYFKIVEMIINTPELLNKIEQGCLNSAFWLLARHAVYSAFDCDDEKLNALPLKTIDLILGSEVIMKKITRETLIRALKDTKSKGIKKLIQKYTDSSLCLIQ